MPPVTVSDAPARPEAAPPHAGTASGGSRVRRAVLALLAGFLLYAGHPPLDWGWAGFLALVPLIALARDAARDRRPLRSGAAWGLLAGVVFFGALVEWVRFVDWIGVLLLVVIQAAFVAVYVAGLAWWASRRAWPLVAALWWVGLEAVRGAAPFGGFAWGILGYTQHDGPYLLVARSLGVLGVSLVLAGIGASLEQALHRGLRERLADALRPLAAGAVLAAAGLALTLVPAPQPSGATVDIAAVQGFDVEGSTGRSLPRAVRIAQDHVAVTEQLGTNPAPDLLVWPENALDGEPQHLAELAEAVEAGREAARGAPLLAGVIAEGPTDDTWENTVAVYDDDPTEPRDRYVKRQPVPFGEYIPFRSLIGWYPPIERMRPTDAVAGSKPGVLDTGVDGLRVGAVICFESVFPRLVHSQVDEGANLLVVATNNSSFGRTGMSPQHLAFSSLRAVETGRWVVHAALTGKSGIVDPDGGVHQETGHYEQALMRAELPLVEDRTLATTVGDGVGWASLALALGGFAPLVWTRGRRRLAERAAAGPQG